MTCVLFTHEMGFVREVKYHVYFTGSAQSSSTDRLKSSSPRHHRELNVVLLNLTISIISTPEQVVQMRFPGDRGDGPTSHPEPELRLSDIALDCRVGEVQKIGQFVFR